jgi:hypothetical protein
MNALCKSGVCASLHSPLGLTQQQAQQVQQAQEPVRRLATRHVE